ncbi:MAG TPA: hypothetical protein VMU56_04260 [Beijerinckiaceae bacterium]|nr:hypothetical protein [Beijerinckiaceae bacterium]
MAIDQEPRIGDPSIRGPMTRRASPGSGPIGAIIVVVVLVAAAIAYWGWHGGAVHEGRSAATTTSAPATPGAPAASGPATTAPMSAPSPAPASPAGATH